MLSPPEDLDDALVGAALREHWGIDAAERVYAPVGFGSHHWDAVGADGRRWFVTADDLDAKPWFGPDRAAVLAGLRTAYGTAAELRDGCGLSFVLGPRLDHDGVAAHAVTDRWAVSVVPRVEGETGGFADHFPAERRDEMALLLAELHQAQPAAVRPRDDASRGDRDAVVTVLDGLGEPWTGGPWSEPARAWCVENADDVRRLVERHDVLAEHAAGRPRVVTHGEPHPGNVLVSDDRCLLIDWDTVAAAPPERDLWLAAGGWDGPVDEAFLESYQRLSGVDVDRDVLTLYRITWVLSDVASLAGNLRRAHTRTPTSDAVWGYLRALRLDVD
ncbi:MAG: aminoglycoside phosphotransferase family protein [Actinomycetales bacterium]|nr:aminoglycoside phosphotransferase family protein [Actinomycetales bacterium]